MNREIVTTLLKHSELHCSTECDSVDMIPQLLDLADFLGCATKCY